MATDNIAEQLSCSWHWSPSDPSTDTPIFKEFASQGQSLFVAAGDTGAYSSSSITYPADDAWVTSVGGTDLSINADGSWSSESAWPHGGGGVSPNKIPIPWEGALGIVPPECDGCYVSTEFPVFDVIEELVLPEVLDVHFRSPTVWPDLSGASTGTNVRRRRLNPTDFLAYKLPLPSRAVQFRLRVIKSEMQKAEPLQAQVATELRALMPSILSKAFSRGLL